MLEAHHELSLRLIEVIPFIMRSGAAELRQSKHFRNPVHFGVLISLAYGPCILSDLAEQQAVSPPTMSNTITTLVKHGWVQRHQDDEDRRKVWLSLTPAGEQVLLSMRENALNVVDQYVAYLSSTDQEKLNEGLIVLQKLVDLVHTQTKGLVIRNDGEPHHGANPLCRQELIPTAPEANLKITSQ